jgi:hypothetical protein
MYVTDLDPVRLESVTFMQKRPIQKDQSTIESTHSCCWRSRGAQPNLTELAISLLRAYRSVSTNDLRMHQCGVCGTRDESWSVQISVNDETPVH